MFAMVLMVGGAAATTVSLSDIKYESSNAEFFDGSLIAIEMTADDSTEELQIQNVPASSISSRIQGETNQDIQIEASQVDKWVEYSTSDTNKGAINRWSAVKKQGFASKEDAKEWMYSNCDSPAYIDKYLDWTIYDYEVHCFQKGEKLAEVGDFREDSSSPRSQFKVEYELSIDGQPSTSAILSNNDVGQGKTAELGSQARIKYLGSYSLSTSPEGTSSGAMAAQSDDFTSGWRVISEDDFNTYDDFVDTEMSSLLKEYGNGVQTQQQIENKVNGIAQEAVSEHSTHPLSEARVKDSGINSAVLEYTPDQPMLHPSMIMYLDAGQQDSDAVTISKSAGVPEIQSVTGGEVNELGRGSINVVAKNAGSEEGEFNVRITSCTDGFTFDDAPRQSNIPAGSTEEFNLQVGFDGESGTDDISGACEVELEESTTGVSATRSAELTGVQEGQCNADSPYPTVQNGNEVVAECQSGEEVIVEQCSAGEVTNFKEGEWICDSQEDAEGNGWFGTTFTPFEDIQNALSGGLGFIETVSLMLGVIVTFAASLFTFGVSYRSLFNKFMLDEVTKDFGVAQSLVRLVFAGIMTAMVGFLVYTVASNIWIQLFTLAGIIVAGYLYVQYGAAIDAIT